MALTTITVGTAVKGAPFYAFATVAEKTSQFAMTAVGVSATDDIASSLAENTEWVLPEREVTRILVERFRTVPEVVSICAQFGSDGISIWTLLKEHNPEARERVYEKEIEICRTLGAHDFDFRVTSVDLVSPSDLIGSGSIEIFRR